MTVGQSESAVITLCGDIEWPLPEPMGYGAMLLGARLVEDVRAAIHG